MGFSPNEGHITHGEALRAHPFMAGLSEGQIARVEPLAFEVCFDEDEVIIRNRQRSTACYLLLTGSVVVELRAPNFAVCVQVLGPGDMFGWSAILDNQYTLFQVRSRERSAALCIDGAALAAACREDPQLEAELLRRTLRVVAGRIKSTEAVFAEMCGLRVPPGVADGEADRPVT